MEGWREVEDGKCSKRIGTKGMERGEGWRAVGERRARERRRVKRA